MVVASWSFKDLGHATYSGGGFGVVNVCVVLRGWDIELSLQLRCRSEIQRHRVVRITRSDVSAEVAD
ncbi:hypothetical protein E3A20_09360 [Planctomyces bekefii]|uniref:Uncharacterized protein n=1 Tax=Planctomyces bekefii TaxID=1653850 RepID=A0A5C6M709_9PLAN|nr:hypothetical protein E3A20_09360 [Planctomyces bekefii]